MKTKKELANQKIQMTTTQQYNNILCKKLHIPEKTYYNKIGSPYTRYPDLSDPINFKHLLDFYKDHIQEDLVIRRDPLSNEYIVINDTYSKAYEGDCIEFVFADALCDVIRNYFEDKITSIMSEIKWK